MEFVIQELSEDLFADEWRQPPLTSDNLRKIIRAAPEGTSIEIPPDEFEGPFICDHPIRLVGKGDSPRAATLWTRRGPTIIVRSPGVSFTNIQVELTLPEARQKDVTIWYRHGCRPDTNGAHVQGRVEEMGTIQSSGWSLPNIIDLGDLWAKHGVKLPMAVQVPGPARLHGELAGLQVEPSQLPVGGIHLIHVAIPGEKLIKDTMLAGQVVIESSGEIRAVWIIGRVLEDEFKAWIKEKIVLIGKNKHKFGGAGIALGKEHLRGEPGADQLPDQQAYIWKEASGVWSLFQPLWTPSPMKVNGQILGVGQRLVLKGKETIAIDNLKLIVEANKTNLPLTVDSCIDFGKLSARTSANPPMLSIQNTEKSKWEGTLRSTVTWIQTPQSQVSCPAKKTIQVPVQLGSGLHNLPQKVNLCTGALVLEGQKETWHISARLEVDIQQGLEVNPTTVDFGQVSQPATAPPQRVHVRNTGSTPWKGTIQATVPWLTVDKTSVQCAAGADAEFDVRLTDQVQGLSEGSTTLTEAIKIEGQNLNATVAVRLHFTKPKVQLDIQPRTLDWGKVTDWRSAQTQTIQVRNTGDKDWQGKTESKVPWIEVTPATVQCPVQGQAALTVSLTDRFTELAVGEQKIPAALRIEGEGLAFSCLARVVVDIPLIQLNTTHIDLVLDDRSNLPAYTLRLKNPGSQVWHGKIKNTVNRWLVVAPLDITCQPGAEAEINVTLLPQVATIFKKPKIVKVDDAIFIESSAPPLSVGVQLEVKDLSGAVVVKAQSVKAQPVTAQPVKAEKQPVPPPSGKEKTPPKGTSQKIGMIDFGEVSDWSKTTSQEIRFSNSQTHTIKGTVQNTLPYLEVSPDSFTCLPGKEVVLTVRLTKGTAKLRAKAYDVPDAVIIKTDDKKYLVHICLNIVGKTILVSQPATTPPVEEKQPLVKNVKPPVPSTLPPGEEKQTPQPQKSEPIATDWENKTIVITKRARVKTPPPSPVNKPSASQAKTPAVDQTVQPQASSDNDSADNQIAPQQSSSGKGPVIQPKPQPLPEALVVEPPMIDWGRIKSWRGTLPGCEVKVSNGLKTVWQGTIRSTVPWLEVTPAEITCQPGATVTLQVNLVPHSYPRRAKTYSLPDALIIEGSGQTLLVEVCLTVI